VAARRAAAGTLVFLPACSPELNTVERVWLYLRERFLSLRLLPSTEAIIDACCDAWRRLVADPDRLTTLCGGIRATFSRYIRRSTVTRLVSSTEAATLKPNSRMS
jgi:hypothetical protein